MCKPAPGDPGALPWTALKGGRDGQGPCVENTEGMKAEANLLTVVATRDEDRGFMGDDLPGNAPLRGFVGADPVELLDNGIEPPLLLLKGVGRWLAAAFRDRDRRSCRPFSRGLAGRVPYLGNWAQAPHGQGSNRRPVVRAQGFGQPIFPNRPLHPRPHCDRMGTAQSPTLQLGAACRCPSASADNTASVAQSKIPLADRTPTLSRPRVLRRRSWPHQPVPPQYLPSRAVRWASTAAAPAPVVGP